MHALVPGGYEIMAATGDTFTMPDWGKAMIGTLVLIIIFASLGRKYSWANIIVGLLAFFGIAGVAAVASPFKKLQEGLNNLIAAGVHSAGGGATAVWIVTIVIALLGVCYFLYRRQQKLGVARGIVVMVLCTLPLFLNATLLEWSLAYMTHIGIPVYQFFAGIAVAITNFVSSR